MQQQDAVINTGIKQSVRHFHMLGVVAPFAAASSGGANTFVLLTKAMAKFIKVTLSWLHMDLGCCRNASPTGNILVN